MDVVVQLIMHGAIKLRAIYANGKVVLGHRIFVQINLFVQHLQEVIALLDLSQ